MEYDAIRPSVVPEIPLAPGPLARLLYFGRLLPTWDLEEEHQGENAESEEGVDEYT